jgi:MFS family permease
MVNLSFGCYRLSNRVILAFFAFNHMILYLDRGVIASLVPGLQDSDGLNISSLQAGALGSVFIFGYMLASPLFAYLAQIIHPFFLISFGMTIWGGSGILGGLSRSFWPLIVSRGLFGIGDAAPLCLSVPIIIQLAPADKKTLWISTVLIFLPVGYALGYAIAPGIKNGSGGWYNVFFVETALSLPCILIPLLAYKDPNLIFIKDQKSINIIEQVKLLSKNLVYIFIVLSNISLAFIIGGLGFWAPSILQEMYRKSETTASLSVAAIILISGIVAVLIGSMLLDRMMNIHKISFDNNQISEAKFNQFRAEKSTKFTFIACMVGGSFLILGASASNFVGSPMYKGPFIFFLICISIALFVVFL